MTVRRPPLPVGGALSLVGLMGSLALVGCSGADGGDAGSASPAATTTTSAAPASTTAAPAYALPESCSSLLSLSQLDDAIGVAIPGETTHTIGLAEPAVGRTGRVTCGFGVLPATDTEGATDPVLELSVFTYTDATTAADRIAATVDAQQSQGARTEELTVAGVPTVLVAGSQDSTLVARIQARTYSVTLVSGVLDPAATSTALQRLMGDVLAADAPDLAAGPGAGTTTSPSAASGPTG